MLVDLSIIHIMRLIRKCRKCNSTEQTFVSTTSSESSGLCSGRFYNNILSYRYILLSFDFRVSVRAHLPYLSVKLDIVNIL